MTSIDLKKSYAEHYSAQALPSIVEVPSRLFLMIDGAGDPNTSAEYTDAIKALYPLAYGLRAAVKAATGDAYVVMPFGGSVVGGRHERVRPSRQVELAVDGDDLSA